MTVANYIVKFRTRQNQEVSLHICYWIFVSWSLCHAIRNLRYCISYFTELQHMMLLIQNNYAIKVLAFSTGLAPPFTNTQQFSLPGSLPDFYSSPTLVSTFSPTLLPTRTSAQLSTNSSATNSTDARVSPQWRTLRQPAGPPSTLSIVNVCLSVRYLWITDSQIGDCQHQEPTASSVMSLQCLWSATWVTLRWGVTEPTLLVVCSAGIPWTEAFHHQLLCLLKIWCSAFKNELESSLRDFDYRTPN